MTNPRLLVLCQRGNVRSVTVATVLKDYCMQDDVVVAGTETVHKDTLQLLVNWAEYVLLAGVALPEEIAANKDQVVALAIGADVWGVAMHPEIVRRTLDELARLFPALIQHTRWPKDVYVQLVEQKFELKDGLRTT